MFNTESDFPFFNAQKLMETIYFVLASLKLIILLDINCKKNMKQRISLFFSITLNIRMYQSRGSFMRSSSVKTKFPPWWLCWYSLIRFHWQRLHKQITHHLSSKFNSDIPKSSSTNKCMWLSLFQTEPHHFKPSETNTKITKVFIKKLIKETLVKSFNMFK